VKTEVPGSCETVNCKLCKSAIALYCVLLRELVTKILINSIIRTRTRHFCHAYHPTCENTQAKIFQYFLLLKYKYLSPDIVQITMSTRVCYLGCKIDISVQIL
jgi:hypothetical protein